VAAASTSGMGNPGSHAGANPHGPPGGGGGGMARPTVGGKVTALSGDDVTVQTQADKTTTVVYSSSTTFRTMSGSSGAPGTAKSTASTSASALKVGDYVGVLGTKNANGTVTASSITISTSPLTGGKAGGPPGAGKDAKDGAPPTGTPPGASG
jgi:hypothetical protein